MLKNFFMIIFILLFTTSPSLAARDKVLEEHVNHELEFFKNIPSCTPLESAEQNFNVSRKIYGEENNTCHFLYSNNLDCHVPSGVAQKFSQAGLRVYNEYSDYGLITSATADMKYMYEGVLYNTRYCRVKR